MQNLFYLLFTLAFAVMYYFIFMLIKASQWGKNFWERFIRVIIPPLQEKLVKTQKSRLLLTVIVAILVMLSIVLFIVHVKIITFPYQLELREGSQQLTTYAFLNGINPYSIPNNPKYINIYGVLFNIFMLPFASFLGNTLQLHRLINGFLILAQALIMIKVMRSQKVGWLASVIAAGFIWLGLLFFSTPLARPDALGGCLFLLAIFIPWFNKFDTKSLAISAVLGVLSYQTKFYFFLSIVIIASYLFFFISKRKAILYTAAAGSLFVIAVFIIYRTFDTYFVNSLYVSSGSLAMNFEKMFEQVYKFLRDYWGLFIFAFFFLNAFKIDRFKKKLDGIKFEFLTFNKPLLSTRLDFLTYCLAVTFLIVVLVLNNGTSQVYYYHLVTPFLVFLVMSHIDKLQNYKNWVLLLAVLSLITQSVENLKPDFASFDRTNWEKLETMISQSKEVLNSPVDVSILIDQNKPITISGHTQYYFLFPTKRFFLFPDLDLMRIEGEKFTEQIGQKIKNKEYDFLETIENDNYEKFLIGERLDKYQSDQKFISGYYHIVEILTIPMMHTNEVWKIGIWEPN